ncbi:MAG TPA: hypothetical protein VE487_18155, partial [Ilumatobacter sp.]|nr:hypothetical protein [Ilumatobacter sp.]
LAFAVGWMLGRGGSDADSGNPSPSTAAAPTVPRELTGSTLPTVEGELFAATTTLVPGWTFASAGVDDRAAALGIRVIGVRPGLVLELDTATGELAKMHVETHDGQPPHVDAGEDWILVRRTDSSYAQLFRGRDDPVPVRVGRATNAFPEPGTDRFWRVLTAAQRDAPTRVVQIDHAGAESGVAFEFEGPGQVAGADPAGGVVVVAPGGSYHAGTDGSKRLTAGDVIAISAQQALITECSDDLTTCGLVVLDRDSGATTALEPVLPVGNPDVQIYSSGSSYGFPSLLSAISPDGRHAPIVINGTRLRFGVIDLESGDVAPLGVTPQSGLWWAPDGRYVMYLFNERLMLYDFETRTAFEVAPGMHMTAFAVRPRS